MFLISALATASLFAQGDRVAVWLAGASTLQGLIILVLSFKYGMGGRSKTDVSCLILALVGIVLWQTTQMPIIALFFAIGADFVGMVPAIIKTYHFPKTEIWSFFALDVFAAIFSMMALNNWTVAEFSYPIYIFIINIVMVLLITKNSFFKRIRFLPK